MILSEMTVAFRLSTVGMGVMVGVSVGSGVDVSVGMDVAVGGSGVSVEAAVSIGETDSKVGVEASPHARVSSVKTDNANKRFIQAAFQNLRF